MSNRTIIWFRDASVIILVIYVVSAVALAPWSNLKPTDSVSDSCATGCPPSLDFPENGYYHYKNELTFTWKPVSVVYLVEFQDENFETIISQNITDTNTFRTSKLVSGNYTSFVFFKGISGAYSSEAFPLIFSEEHKLNSSSKVDLIWAESIVSYNIQIKLQEDSDVSSSYHPIVHEANIFDSTSYDYSDFSAGNTYIWSVVGITNFTDSLGNKLGFESERSLDREVNIDTTKFLAFELFEDWALPFILLGVLMVIALQAGVFLAREEKDD